MTRLELLEIYKTLFGRFLHFKKDKVVITINQKLWDDFVNDVESREKRAGVRKL